MNKKSFDIAIVGGGIVGLTLALALAKRTALTIAVFEAGEGPTWSDAGYHHRVSAISLSSQRIFQSLNIWSLIKNKRISPFTSMHVWDEKTQAEINFSAADIQESALGFILENNLIHSVLKDEIQRFTTIAYFPGSKLKQANFSAQQVELVDSTDTIYHARLAVAADGANSWLRAQAHISVKTDDYAEQAIVTTVQTEKPHQKCAQQVFLSSGPLAYLPLEQENLSSIVWSLPKERAQELMQLSEEEFKKELASAFEYKLGEIVKLDKRYIFPLYKQQADCYVKARLALVGDAAHTIHPLAGQGVNMGLLDAASLFDVIVAGYMTNRDYSSLHHLRRYERWRKADNLPLMTGVDWIKKIFASDGQAMQVMRSNALNFANNAHWLKNIFLNHALGKRQFLPKLALSGLVNSPKELSV